MKHIPTVVAVILILRFVIVPLVTEFQALVAQKIADAICAVPQFAPLKHRTPHNRFFDRLDAAFARATGAATVTPDQSQILRAAFRVSVPDQRTDPEARAAFDIRYASNDDTLIDEFVKDYIAGDWVWQLRKDLNDANGGGLDQ